MPGIYLPGCINFVLIFTQKKEIEVKIQNISDKRIF